jgi:hypothetical protein
MVIIAAAGGRGNRVRQGYGKSRHSTVITAFTANDAVTGIYGSAIRSKRLLRADAPVGGSAQLIVEVLLDEGIDKDIHPFMPQVAAMR